jgi:hypothetical protein
MSASQSNLSSTGFDYVVAVTEDSVNSTLEEYLFGGLPQVNLCYVYDTSNNPVPIDYATFVASANNTDPFSVPNATPSTDPRVQNLSNANFAFAIRAKLGLPPGVLPANLPSIVTLKPGQSDVSYTLMFSEFIATELIFGPRGSVTWFNQSQPSGTPWTFTGPVDLDFQDAAFENLPVSVQNQLKGLENQGATFSVQQLYYDLNSSQLEQGFQFNNIPTNSALNTFMTADFVNTYWKALGGAEVLGYGASQTSSTPPSSLAITDLNFFVPDAVGTEGAPLTLNYLCATNNDTLPDTTHAGFGWNWVEPAEASQFDGVAALNRNTLAHYFDAQLRGYVASNCFMPTVSVSYNWKKAEFEISWNIDNGVPPAPTFPATGATVLSYAYDSGEVKSEASGGGCEMKLRSTFDLSVNFQGDTIVITQHLVFYFYLRVFATKTDSNAVDKQIVDTYTLAVDDEGKITTTLSSQPTDNSKTPDINAILSAILGGVNKVTDTIAGILQDFAETSFTDIPVSFVQNFVFPGGQTFLFSDVTFSENQDLVSHITYAAPSSSK